MIGSSASIPYDALLFWLLLVIGGVLLVGTITASAWPPGAGLIVRRGALLLAAIATSFVLLWTPSRDPFIRLGRVFTVWCPIAAIALLFATWSWRAGQW